MKYSIIEDIFYGRRGQAESMGLTEKNRKLNDKCIELFNDFQKSLNNSQKKELENLINHELDAAAEMAFDYYKEGLKIGLLLLCECLED